MKLQAFISGLPESLAGGPLLLAIVVGIWVALGFTLNQRYKNKHRSVPVDDSFVEPSSADRRRNIVAAANRINLDLGSMWLPPSPGDGYNKNLVPGREGIVGYTDYDKDFHSPRDIDRRRVSPRGVPQVPLVQEPHENVVLIVIDANQLELAGGPDDELTKLEVVQDIVLTILEWAKKDNHVVGLLATRDRQPIYLKPGSSLETITEAIHRLQAGTSPAQDQELKRLAVEHSQRAKAVFVVGHFDSDDSLKLVRQLPIEARKIAVQVISQWQRQIGGLPAGRFGFEGSNGTSVRFDTVRDDETHRQEAQEDLDQVEHQVKPGGVAYCRVHLDQPDPPGQLVAAINREFHD